MVTGHAVAPEFSSPDGHTLRRVAAAVAWACVALGLAGLAGWAFHVPILTTVVPGLPAVKANTALVVTLSGVALLARARDSESLPAKWTARVLMAPVAIVSLLTLVEYIAGASLGLDTAILGAAQRATGMAFPGRMAVESAVCFLLLSIVIAFLDSDIAYIVVVLPAALGVVGVSGYVDALWWSHHVTPYSAMTVQSAVAVTLLSAGAVLARPDRGVTSILRERSVNGSLARWLTFAAFALPLGIGWVLYDLERDAVITNAAHAGLTIVVTIVALTLFAQFLTTRIRRAERAHAAADTARLQADANFRELFESAPVGLFRSLPDGTILDGNPALLKLLGLPDHAALLAHNARDFYVDPTDRDRFVEQLMKNGTVTGMEFRFQRVDRVVRWVESHAHAVRSAGGGITHLAGSFIDITPRKLTEAQFLAAQRLEAVGRLAGGVAHDFNNLLTVVQSTAELLRADMESGNVRLADIEEILRTTKRAGTLTRQLLAFSRRQVLEPRVLNLNDIVVGMDSLLRRILGDDIRLDTECASELGNVRADPAQLEQVIANLAVNARDAMPDGGTLTIETANVTLDTTYADANLDVTPGRYVMLSVSDTGEGIPPNIAARVFEPFFTTKGPTKGTGLGLATVYGIVRQSGGSVKLYSEVGVGTTFNVYLPLVADALDAPRDPAREPIATSTAGSGETILVVDDDTSVRGTTVRILKRLGYTVLEASESVGWRELAETHQGRIHLLLTDVVMAGMSGPEIAQEFRRLRPEARVMFTSGYADRATQSGEIIPAHAMFIQKPFAVEELSRKVREALRESDLSSATQ